MTLVIAAMSILLTLTSAAFARGIADVSGTKMRAQIAADAAALGAVAESGPYGSGSPELIARQYAQSNGATLVECVCRAGATAMQVEVRVGDVVARARAVIDPSAFAPAAVVSADGLHPALRRAVDTLIRAARGSVYVVSGYRSSQEQAQLWSGALARYGDPEAADDWVARPGTSAHERGVAVDLGGDVDTAVRLIEELGLPMYRPLTHEPWHFELAGSRH
ncbi:MAG TPA: D-alanyl-D-alanine carboxypeptidase family protein [Actinomycetota bacterium]|nr:D-alanyl-D-alanine carboxypeptidase family protein [Actinomycetota bacterium]